MDHYFFFSLLTFFFFFFSIKFGTDADNATNLISIPQYFDLEIYAEHRLQKVSVLTVHTYFTTTLHSTWKTS